MRKKPDKSILDNVDTISYSVYTEVRSSDYGKAKHQYEIGQRDFG